MSFPKYVFISYSSKDIVKVNKIVELLESMNVEYWKAPEKIPAGSSYANEIVNAIENCSLFLVILSENAQSSIWVEKEIDCALSSAKEVIPYNIDNCVLVNAFKFYLNNVQMIHDTPGSPEGIDKLKGFLRPLQPAESKSSGTNVNIPMAPEQKIPAPKAPDPKAAAKKSNLKTATQTDSNTVVKRYQRGMRMDDMWNLNRVPVVCKHCGGSLTHVAGGVYVCNECKAENYDDFRTIRNYLIEHGPCSALELSKALGIPMKIIKNWQKSQ